MKRLLIFLFCFSCFQLCFAANVTNLYTSQQLYSGMQLTGVPGSGITNVTGGLMGWWRLDEGTGTNAVDSSSFASNASLKNLPTWTNGVIGNAIVLNGSSSYMNITSIPTNLTAITISIWVKFVSLAGAYTGIASRNANPYFYQLFVKSDGKVAAYISLGGVGYDDTGSHTLVTNTWYHLAMVYDSSVGLIGYVNGSLDKVGGTNGVLSNVNAPFTIGNDIVNGGRVLNGMVDDVRVYNRALTTNEISLIYAWRGEP